MVLVPVLVWHVRGLTCWRLVFVHSLLRLMVLACSSSSVFIVVHTRCCPYSSVFVVVHIRHCRVCSLSAAFIVVHVRHVRVVIVCVFLPSLMLPLFVC